MNWISKLYTIITFCVGIPFLPINEILFSWDTYTQTCVPLITPMQFYMTKQQTFAKYDK
jgi:hypothetical protein